MNGSSDAVVAAPSPAGHFLFPGTVYCAAVPTVISTTLGSCVAVCLWDGTLRLGGMNHFALPHRNQDGQNPRFGDAAIDQLVNGMLRLGCSPGRLRAKIVAFEIARESRRCVSMMGFSDICLLG